MQVGNSVELVGLTRHGKNRVREQGSVYTITKMQDTVFFSNESGPWLHVQSTTSEHGRWVHATRDKNFKPLLKE